MQLSGRKSVSQSYSVYHPDCQLEIKDLRKEMHDYLKGNDLIKENL